jgi:hypothetical protein
VATGDACDSTQSAYKDLVRKELSPGLRTLGFVGSGGQYSLPCQDCWVLLGFQKSKWNTTSEVSFTINLLVASKATWPQLEPPSANIMHDPPAVHARIGHLIPGSIEDRWWQLSSSDDLEDLGAQVLQCVEAFAVPWLTDQMRALGCTIGRGMR